MKRLFLFFLVVFACSAQNPIVSGMTFDNVTADSFRVRILAAGNYRGARIAFSVSPADCTQPNSGGNPVFYDDLYPVAGYNVSASRTYVNSVGHTPDTVYNVCPQLTVNGSTWYGGSVMASVRTLSAPATGVANVPRAAKVNTDYPSDFVTRTNIHPYPQTAGCPTLSTDFHSAMQNLATENAEITIPAGQSNGCFGRIPLDYITLPPDVKVVPYSSVNTDGSVTITGTSYSTNQQIIVTPGSSDMPAQIVRVDYQPTDGRLYYLQPKAGATATYFVYDGPLEKGGKRLLLTRNGSGNFNVTPYPRQLKDIFIRTATPDSQFAAPGTALGGLSWLSQMAWLINPAGNRADSGNPAHSGTGLLDASPLVSHVRFVGIAFTTEDVADAYTTPDPRAWRKFLYLPPTTQNIIVDRCAFFSPSLQQRVYDALEINGINNAVVNSYFDKTITFFHDNNDTTGVFQTGARTMTVQPGRFTAGVSQSVLSNAITLTLSGVPTSGSPQRFVTGFPMSNSSVLQVYLPSGVSGSCTGGTCAFTTRNASTGGPCNAYNGAQWPLDAHGQIGIKMVSCGDVWTDGTISYLANTFVLAAPGTPADIEGCQCVQGAYGPGPITWRNNDTFMGGNEWHLGNDGGYNVYKSDYWIYRNRISPYWGGLMHAGNPEADGNSYGLRSHKIEFKGARRITMEGNNFLGNFNSYSTADVSVLIALRNENQGLNDVVIDSNIFQHLAGLFDLADLNGGPVDGGQGVPGGNVLVQNNVSWDINEKGPDTFGVGSLGSFPGGSGIGSYASSLSNNSGAGYLDFAGSWRDRVTYRNNTFPDIRGRISTLVFGPGTFTGGFVLKDNFLSINQTPWTNGLGARPGGGAAAGCTTNGRPYLTCAYPGSVVNGNVFLSYTNSASDLTADGWGTGNTVPSNPASKTTIWPKYNVQDWHHDLDPEMYRLPVGSAYAGKGADITVLKAKMGWVEGESAWFTGANALTVSWLDHDELGQACVVDVAAPGQLYSTFSRFALDSASTQHRSITIPAINFSAHTAYDVAINCETKRTVLHARSN
jgi:hypothetical protein